MTTTTLHTPLEVFLFFQSLRVLGPEPSSFIKISGTLKENEFIKENKDYQPDRLNPDSLKELYLDLLKEELHNERIARSSPSRDANHNPRKRKLSSPPSPPADEANEHKRLLPQLVDRLYARYREHVIKSIEDEEKKYRALQQDIEEIERGEWDTRLQQQENSTRRGSRGVASIQTLLRDDAEDNVRDGENRKQRAEQFESSSQSVHSRQDSGSYNEPHARAFSIGNSGDATQSSAYVATRPDGSRIADLGIHHSRGSSTSGIQQGFSPRLDTIQNASRPTSQSRMADTHAPYLPPINYAASSPTTDTSRRLPPPQQMGAPLSASPRLNQLPLIPPERSSASPIILPPPPGMLRSSGSPAGPLDALADMAGHQHRSNPSLPSPRLSQSHNTQPHPNQLPQPRNYMQRQYPYYDSQTPYVPPYSPYGQSPGVPYQSPNQTVIPSYANPSQGFPQRTDSASYHQASFSTYPQYQGYPQAQPVYQATSQTTHMQQSQPLRPPFSSTPASTGPSKLRGPRPPSIHTSVSSTQWKRTDRPESNESPGSPSPPQPEDVSPISPKAPSPVPNSPGPQGKPPGKKGKNQPGSKTTSPADETLSASTKTAPKPTKTRQSRTTTRRTRAASTASSTLGASANTHTRSVSPVSHTDELSRDPTRSSRRIKHEPPATPAAPPSISSTNSTPALEAPRTTIRRRASTLRSLETPPTIRASTKRKRAPTLEATPDIQLPPPTPQSRPNQVLASRNFPRTSAPIMNDITTHKLASLFAKPLTEREAPGYRDVIYQPQDLKSIKGAISAGSRAVAAKVEAGAGDESGGGTGSVGGSVWIEKTADVVPPKGIVNSAQLEKEVCRMFANAVMFNPDPKRGLGVAFRTRARRRAAREAAGKTGDEDSENEEEDVQGMDVDDGGGVVRDTREMFETVDKAVGGWRAAERIGEDGRRRAGSEADELAGEDVDGDGEGGRKRRRW